LKGHSAENNATAVIPSETSDVTLAQQDDKVNSEENAVYN
jgi:hypothetical protein